MCWEVSKTLTEGTNTDKKIKNTLWLRSRVRKALVLALNVKISAGPCCLGSLLPLLTNRWAQNENNAAPVRRVRGRSWKMDGFGTWPIEIAHILKVALHNCGCLAIARLLNSQACGQGFFSLFIVTWRLHRNQTKSPKFLLLQIHISCKS